MKLIITFAAALDDEHSKSGEVGEWLKPPVC